MRSRGRVFLCTQLVKHKACEVRAVHRTARKRQSELGPIEVNRPYLQQLAHAIYRAEINVVRTTTRQLLRH